MRWIIAAMVAVYLIGGATGLWRARSQERAAQAEFCVAAEDCAGPAPRTAAASLAG